MGGLVSLLLWLLCELIHPIVSLCFSLQGSHCCQEVPEYACNIEETSSFPLKPVASVWAPIKLIAPMVSLLCKVICPSVSLCFSLQVLRCCEAMLDYECNSAPSTARVHANDWMEFAPCLKNVACWHGSLRNKSNISEGIAMTACLAVHHPDMCS